MRNVQGVERLTAKIRRLRTATEQPIRKAVGQAADMVVAAQQRLAPNRKGNLDRSITWGFGDSPKYATLKIGGGPMRGKSETRAVITAGNAQVRTAHIVERGQKPHILGGIFKGAMHPGATGRFFFRGGYQSAKPKAKRLIAKAVRDALRDIARS